MKIGILDIQGSVEEHFDALKKLSGGSNGKPVSKSAGKQKIEPVLVKKAVDFADLDGLVLPGGESTTISKLLKLYGLDREIIALAKRGGKIFGTCAGAILLAKKIIDEKNGVESLGLIDIDIERNSYGRQLDSFETRVTVKGSKGRQVPAVFIRAPRISRVGDKCEILAEYEGEPVLVKGGQSGNILVATFHPEMTEDTSVYEMFFL